VERKLTSIPTWDQRFQSSARQVSAWKQFLKQRPDGPRHVSRKLGQCLCFACRLSPLVAQEQATAQGKDSDTNRNGCGQQNNHEQIAFVSHEFLPSSPNRGGSIMGKLKWNEKLLEG
jgi:hypothetical protein